MKKIIWPDLWLPPINFYNAPRYEENMRTKTGDYRIDFFDKYGERMADAETATNLGAAHAVASVKAPDEANSYTIFRCIYNSLDDAE
jgi:hypothetical protein